MAELVEKDGIFYRLFPNKEKAEVSANNQKTPQLVGKKKKIEVPISECDVQKINDYPEIYSIRIDGNEYIDTGSLPKTVWRSVQTFPLVDVVIPNTICHDGIECEVTSVAENAFNRCGTIQSVVFPSTLKFVGNNAFLSCDALKRLTFLGDVNIIGEETLGNTAITDIYLKFDVKKYDNIVRYLCYSIKGSYCNIRYLNPDEVTIHVYEDTDTKKLKMLSDLSYKIIADIIR